MINVYTLVLVVQLSASVIVDLRGVASRPDPTRPKLEFDCDFVNVGNQRAPCAFGKRVDQVTQKCIDAQKLPINSSCALSLLGWNPSPYPNNKSPDRPLSISFSKGGLSLWNVSHNLSLRQGSNLTMAQGLSRSFAMPKASNQKKSRDGEITFDFPPETMTTRLPGVDGATGLRLSFFVMGSMDFSIKAAGIETLSGNTTKTQVVMPSWNKSITFDRWYPMEHFFSFTKPVQSVHLRVASHGINTLVLSKVDFHFPGKFNPLPPALVAKLTKNQSSGPSRLLQQSDPIIGCYTHSHTSDRGVGVVPSFCPPGTEKNGALCYPNCPSGYYGVGPVCWQSCPAGYKDTGTGCQKLASSYDKGCCCVHKPCCKNPFQKCFYDWSCNNGCCDNCRAGYSDTGCTCYSAPDYFIKKTIGRGAGTIMSCQPDQEEDASLCYVPCPSGYHGAGPLCWETICLNPSYPTACGVAVCTVNEADCRAYATAVAAATGESVGGAAACTEEGEDCSEWLANMEQAGANLAAQTAESIAKHC